MIRVMVVDDHEVVRAGVRALINDHEDMHVVAEAADADAAVARVAESEPDVVVMDVRLPSRSGIEACREIRRTRPGTSVLMLTSFSDDHAVFDSIVAGASGYVIKQICGDDLTDSIRRVARGESLLDPASTARLLARIRGRDSEEDLKERLTPLEERIIDLLSEGLTNRQIAQRLHLAEQTIKNYVSTLLRKLGMLRRSEAAAFWARRQARRAAAGEQPR